MSSLWIWPFELEEKIGEGGMGLVYRGRYVKNDRRVAVKLLPEDVADEILLARFEREVEILKTLKHPNIVQSFGGVCEDKRRFYAMELVEGGTLDDLLKSRGGSLPWEQVVELGLQMCAALQYAHENQVIHRDIKPGNFLLTRDRKVKLSDFGLATVVSGTKLTASGKTVGSFRYMAPEQVRGKPAPVPQTDLYALGCLLFQMIVGRPPFDGTTAAELLNKQLVETPPRVSAFVPDCPAALDRLIDSLLKKEIADRPQTAMEVAKQLQAVTLTTRSIGLISEPVLRQKTTGQPAIPARPPAKTRKLPLVILSGFLIVFGSLCVWQWQTNRQLAVAENLWLETYRDTSQPIQIRRHAAIALGKLAQSRPTVLEALTEELQNSDPEVRTATVKALGETGTNARPLIPQLIAMQQRDTDGTVRQQAGVTLQSIQNSPEVPFSWTIPIAAFLAVSILVSGVIWYRRMGSSSE